MLKGILMASGYVILTIVYGGKNVKERNFSMYTYIGLSLITCIWIFPVFFLLTGSYKTTIEMIGTIIATISYPIAITVWAIIVRSKDKKERENILPTSTELNNETNNAEENKFSLEEPKKETPQEESKETIETEITEPLSYKDEKKAARKNYKEQKRLLKATHKKPTPRNFKIITIVLCVILCISVTANILLGFHISELNEEVQSQKYYTELYKNKYNDSLIDFNNLEDEYDNYKSKAIDDFSKAYFLDYKLAFIDADNPHYYHTYDCSAFQNADSYYVHNIEYAESQGYRGHSCVIIRRNSK